MCQPGQGGAAAWENILVQNGFHELAVIGLRAGSLVLVVARSAVAFTEYLAAEGIVPSVRSVGDSFDSALAKSVHSSYKTELIDRQDTRDPHRGV